MLPRFLGRGLAVNAPRGMVSPGRGLFADVGDDRCSPVAGLTGGDNPVACGIAPPITGAAMLVTPRKFRPTCPWDSWRRGRMRAKCGVASGLSCGTMLTGRSPSLSDLAHEQSPYSRSDDHDSCRDEEDANIDTAREKAAC